MNQQSKITMEDLSNAMRYIKENMPPNKKQEFDWGWLETNGVGNPVSIQLKRKYIKEFKRICNYNFRFGRSRKDEPIPKNTKLKEIYGLKVLNTIRMDKSKDSKRSEK